MKLPSPAARGRSQRAVRDSASGGGNGGVSGPDPGDREEAGAAVLSRLRSGQAVPHALVGGKPSGRLCG